MLDMQLRVVKLHASEFTVGLGLNYVLQEK
jgi:hypothetical protein